METIRDRVQWQLGDDGVAEVALARADKMNALDPAMLDALLEVLDRLAAAPGLRAVVLHGQGRAFSAGLDFGSFSGMADGAGSSVSNLETRTHGLANRWQQVCWGWRTLAVPVVAAVHGACLGGGLQIALGADIRIAHPQAQLSVREVHWGLVPDMAGGVFLTELVRPDIVRELTYTGRMVGTAEAAAIGLVTRVDQAPLEAAFTLAREIAGRSPDAVRAAKRLFNAASPVDAGAVLLSESVEQAKLIGAPNQVEAVRAGLEKRKAVFR